MPQGDSVDKIVKAYFAAVTAVPFEYGGHRYEVPRLTVSPLLLRGYTCPAGCGGCCPTFTLDYLPSEEQPPGLEARTVRFDGRDVPLMSDLQRDNSGPRCRNLRPDGRCGIHGVHPFSCDFELIRFMNRGEIRTAHLSQRLFSRGWNMKRTDGGRGSLCEMTPADTATMRDVERKLSRLIQWADHFGLPTRVPLILDWIAMIRLDLEQPEDLVLPALGVTHG